MDWDHALRLLRLARRGAYGEGSPPAAPPLGATLSADPSSAEDALAVEAAPRRPSARSSGRPAAKSAPRGRRAALAPAPLAPARAFLDDPLLAFAGPPRAASLCVASGKGGTGKSVTAASLAALLARRGRTLVVDADMGVGNAHILQRVAPERSLVDVVEGRLRVDEVRVTCRPQLDLVSAGSGVSHMAGLSPYELHLVACGLEELEADYRHLVVDSAAGISPQTVTFAAASDVVLVVTTPDVTAMTDAYAFLKVLWQRRGDCSPLLVVNRAAGRAEALHVAERMVAVSEKFLGRAPRLVGWLPEDPAVGRSVHARRPVCVAEPESPFSVALAALCVRVGEELGRQRPRGLGRALLGSVGAPPARA